MFRVLSALFLSLIYAAFAGGCTFVWWRLTHDPAHPGGMIPDNNEWGRIMVILIIVITALLGAFVALCVSLTQSRKLYAALFGGGVGLVIFLMYLADMLKIVLVAVPHSRRDTAVAERVFRRLSCGFDVDGDSGLGACEHDQALMLAAGPPSAQVRRSACERHMGAPIIRVLCGALV